MFSFNNYHPKTSNQDTYNTVLFQMLHTPNECNAARAVLVLNTCTQHMMLIRNKISWG